MAGRKSDADIRRHVRDHAGSGRSIPLAPTPAFHRKPGVREPATHLRRTPMTEAWIIDACRTPRGIGKIGKGALADIHPQQLSATVLKALAERNALNTADVDDILWGASAQI